MLEVKRSPAKVCWHLLCNGHLILTKPTKQECIASMKEYAHRFGLSTSNA